MRVIRIRRTHMDELLNIAVYLAGGAVVIALVFLLVSEYRKRVAKKAQDAREVEILRKRTEEAQAVKDAEAEAVALKKKKTDRGG